MARILSIVLALHLSSFAVGQESPDGLWTVLDEPVASNPQLHGRVPHSARLFALNAESVRDLLTAIPDKGADGGTQTMTLPLPDATFLEVEVQAAPAVEEKLREKFPHIRTFRGVSKGGSRVRVEVNLKTAETSAQVFVGGDSVILVPSGRPGVVASYSRRSVGKRPGFACLVSGGRPADRNERRRRGGRSVVRVYRLAMACTAEYARFHGAEDADSLDQVHFEVVRLVNRVNEIYERDLGIRLRLVGNNDVLYHTDSETDGFTNDDANRLVSQSQVVIDREIGDANYDVGHTLSTGAGGLARLGCVCQSHFKARGVTGRSEPVGDPFFVDYVAHELGHQFGANHTFNGVGGSCSSTNRYGPTAYEPGSGTTIMGYAGICGRDDDLQVNSDDYFHSASIEEIAAYVTTGAGRDAHASVPSDNRPPEVSAGTDVTVPHRTAFVLRASGSDPDGDALSYCWEQRDLGPAASAAEPDDGSIPLFRSLPPVGSPARILPRVDSLLSGVGRLGEQLPRTSRDLRFRVTVRDGAGATAHDDQTVRVVAESGPFMVRHPNAPIVARGPIRVQWDVARTDQPPIGVTSVNIWLSVDDGNSFTTLLVASTPNDGEEVVELPSGLISQSARIKVEAVGSTFFDLSDTSFVVEGAEEGWSLAVPVEPGGEQLADDVQSVDFDQVVVSARSAAPELITRLRERGRARVTVVEDLRFDDVVAAGRRTLLVADQLEIDGLVKAGNHSNVPPEVGGGALGRPDGSPRSELTLLFQPSRQEPGIGRPSGTAPKGPARPAPSALRRLVTSPTPELRDYRPVQRSRPSGGRGANAPLVPRGPRPKAPADARHRIGLRERVTSPTPELGDYLRIQPTGSRPTNSHSDETPARLRANVTSSTPELADYQRVPGAAVSTGRPEGREARPPSEPIDDYLPRNRKSVE